MLIDERVYFPKNGSVIIYAILRLRFFWDDKVANHYEIGPEVIENAIEEGIPFSYVPMGGFYLGNSKLLTEFKSKAEFLLRYGC